MISIANLKLKCISIKSTGTLYSFSSIPLHMPAANCTTNHTIIIEKNLLHPPSERSETGGHTVFTLVCLSVCLCTPALN